MIRECFNHVYGIGPVTESKLRFHGFMTWRDCIENEKDIPFNGARRRRFIDSLKRSQEVYDEADVRELVRLLPIKEHWRILAEYFERAAFFDIETTGLSWYNSHISVIGALFETDVFTYLYKRNLDDFLLFMEDVDLLVTFNGNCFDIPFVERAFNIPGVDTAHIDLRWIAYYRGFRGGLKGIEKSLGVKRPEEIGDVDGYEAVDLYYQWQSGNSSAGDRLVQYCCCDVVSTHLVAAYLLNRCGASVSAGSGDELFEKAMACSAK